MPPSAWAMDNLVKQRTTLMHFDFKKHALPLALLFAVPLVQAGDPQLVGCWRSQHTEQHMPGKKVLHMNSDCVFDIGEKQGRSECEFKTGRSTTTFDYEVVAPGRYVIKNFRRDQGKVEPVPREVEYRVDGDWLILTSRPEKKGDAPQKVPDKVVGLAVKVRPVASGLDKQTETCRPRGMSPIRVNFGSPSSLMLSVPAGFKPLFSDPASNASLAQAINSNFFIGQFVANDPAGQRNVLVLDDHRVGARPMKAADFAEFKKTVANDIGRDKVSCEDAQKICFNVAFAPEATKGKGKREPPRYLTTIFANVKGRVAIIFGSATGSSPNSAKMAERSSHAFAQRIISDNP